MEDVTKDTHEPLMGESVFDFIIDAMNGALSALDAIGLPDFNDQTMELDRAIDLFYDWYKTKGKYDDNKTHCETTDTNTQQTTTGCDCVCG